MEEPWSLMGDAIPCSWAWMRAKTLGFELYISTYGPKSVNDGLKCEQSKYLKDRCGRPHKIRTKCQETTLIFWKTRGDHAAQV